MIDMQISLLTQRKFIRETTTDLSKDLHKKFAEWVHSKYPTGLSEAEWRMLEEVDRQYNYSGLDEASSQDIEEEVLEAGIVPLGDTELIDEGTAPTY